MFATKIRCHPKRVGGEL